MQYFLHIVTNYNNNVSINGTNVSNIQQSDNKSINIIYNKNIIILSNNPYSSYDIHLLSYTEKIDLSNIKESDLLNIVPFRNNHYEISFNDIPVNISNVNSIISDDYLGKINIVCCNNSCGNILIYDTNKLKKQLQTNLIMSTEIKQKMNKIIIKCLLKNNNYYVAILNIDTINLEFEKICDSIEEDNSNIKILINLKDLTHHGKVFNINIENGNVDDYNIYLKNQPIKTDIPELIPMAFLECIKIKNFNLAREYLSESFTNVSNEHFENYFGEIKEIHFDKYNQKHSEIPYVVKTSNGYENVDFIIDKSKIIDINK